MKENSNNYNKRVAIILGVCAIVYVIFVIIVNYYNREQVIELIIDNTYWKYEKKEWTNINKFTYDNKSNFSVYKGNMYLGEFTLKYHNKWYAFDKNANSIIIDNNLFAINSVMKYKILDFTESSLTDVDLSLISNEMSTDGVSANINLTYKQKINVNLDSDNENESIISISSFPEIIEDGPYFNYVYIVDGNNISILEKNIFSSETFYDVGVYGTAPFKLVGVIDFDRLGNVVILNFNKEDVIVNTMYSYKNGKLKKILSN